MMDGYVSIREIAEKNLSGIALDVFYIVGQHENIFKSAIVRIFCDMDGKDSKHSTYRAPIDNAVSKLEGAMLIESYKSGQKDMYCLTKYGKEVLVILDELIESKPEIIRGTIIVEKQINH